MSLFNFLKSKPFTHPELGQLVWSRGYWRGSLNIPSHGVRELVITGNLSGPNNSAVELATQFLNRFPQLIPAIEQSLFEHFKPYLEAVQAGEFSEAHQPFPDIKKSEDIWPHVKMEYILIEPLLPVGMTIEIAYNTSWDIEHTLGARFHNWKFLEMCGSVRWIGSNR